MCPRFGSCRFFDSPAVAEKGPIGRIERNRFCVNDPERCARYLAASVLGQNAVPLDLVPHKTCPAADLVFARS